MLRIFKFLFYLLVVILGVDVEYKCNVKLDESKWHWEPKYDMMHEMYITNARGKVPTPSGSWGFWEYNPTLIGLYRNSLKKLWQHAVWSWKVKLKKLFK